MEIKKILSKILKNINTEVIKMDKKQKPLSPKQKEFLKKMNYKNINNWTYEQAKKEIDKFLGK